MAVPVAANVAPPITDANRGVNHQTVKAPSQPSGKSGGPVPTAKVLQGGLLGTAYSETISASGGTAPYTFAMTAGSLPGGLTLNSSTGVISGTPTTVETSDFTIQAMDATGATGSTDFEIGITAPVSAGAAAYGWVA